MEGVELTMALNMYEKCVKEAASLFCQKWQLDKFYKEMYCAYK